MDVKELENSIKKLREERNEIKENRDIKISKIKKEANAKMKKIDDKIAILSTSLVKIILPEEKISIEENIKTENITVEENQETQNLELQDIETHIEKPEKLDREDVKIEGKNLYEIKCFIAQYSQNKINDVDILKHLRKLKIQGILDLLNRTVDEKDYLTIEDRKKIIQDIKNGLLNHMLEYNLTDFINKLKNIMKG